MKKHVLLKKTLSIIGAVFALLIVVVCYRHFQNNPQRVLNASIQSAQKQNIASLLSLADPDEIAKYNLNEAKIRRFFSENHVALNPNAPVKTTLLDQRQDGVAFFEVRFDDTPKDHPFHFIVNDSPKHGWRLNLTATLYYMCFQKHGSEGGEIWRDFKRRNGISGTRQTEGNFTLD